MQNVRVALPDEWLLFPRRLICTNGRAGASLNVLPHSCQSATCRRPCRVREVVRPPRPAGGNGSTALVSTDVPFVSTLCRSLGCCVRASRPLCRLGVGEEKEIGRDLLWLTTLPERHDMDLCSHLETRTVPNPRTSPLAGPMGVFVGHSLEGCVNHVTKHYDRVRPEGLADCEVAPPAAPGLYLTPMGSHPSRIERTLARLDNSRSGGVSVDGCPAPMASFEHVCATIRRRTHPRVGTY